MDRNVDSFKTGGDAVFGQNDCQLLDLVPQRDEGGNSISRDLVGEQRESHRRVRVRLLNPP